MLRGAITSYFGIEKPPKIGWVSNFWSAVHTEAFVLGDYARPEHSPLQFEEALQSNPMIQLSKRPYWYNKIDLIQR